MEFLSYGGAAHHGAPFKHQGLEASASQIKSRDQAVVTGPHNDDVARAGHGEGLNPASFPVFEDLERRQAAGGAHDASAGMRG